MLCAYFDVRTRKIPLILLFMISIPPMMALLIERRINIVSVVLGGMVLILRLVLKEAIGGGDAFILWTLLGMFDARIGVRSIIFACIFAFVVGLVNNRGDENLPFVPFILIGLLISITYG